MWRARLMRRPVPDVRLINTVPARYAVSDGPGTPDDNLTLVYECHGAEGTFYLFCMACNRKDCSHVRAVQEYREEAFKEINPQED